MKLKKYLYPLQVLLGIKQPLRLAFVGQMRSGKDTAASYLINNYGGRNVKFTDPLYEIQHAVYAIIDEPEPEKDRPLLQLVGTDWGRNTKRKSIWIDILLERVRSYNFSYYITDVRFENEATALRENGFIVIKVVRDEEHRVKAGAVNMNHASEQEVDNIVYDYIINNNKTLNEFYETLEFLVNSPATQNLIKKRRR